MAPSDHDFGRREYDSGRGDYDLGRVKPRHRTVEIPDKCEHPWRWRWAVLRWRLAIVTVTHPVSIAMVVAFLIASIPAWLILVTANDTRRFTHDAQEQRGTIVRVICDQLNRQARSTNGQARYIEGLIVAGAKQSRAFEPLLRRYRQPSYTVRLRRAEQQARGLDALSVPMTDCGLLLREIGTLTRRTR